MKQNTIEKFTGIQVLQNSFTVNPGGFERLENCVISNDFMVSSRRGNSAWFRLQGSQAINDLFVYQNSYFAVTQDTLYRLFQTAVTATVQSFNASTTISVRKVDHGIRNSDYIAEFLVTNTDAFVAAFPKRQSDTYGMRQVTTLSTALPATRATNVVTVTATNHGMQTGDRITVSASTLSPVITPGTYTITSTGTNSFTFPQVAANSSGTVTFNTIDSFKIVADEAATASVTSATNAASYRYYIVMPGVPVSVTALGVVDARNAFQNKNAYFTTDNGLLKLEREDLPLLEAGIPPGLDLQGYLTLSSTGLNTGPFHPNSQIGYRIVFGRKDANNNFVIGAPSQFLYLRNTILTNKSCAYAAGIVTITSNAHGLTAADVTAGTRVYIYNAVTTGTAIPDGTSFPVNSVPTANTFTIDLNAAGFTGTTNMTSTSYGLARTPQLYFSIPSEIASTQYVYRVYRTSQSESQDALPPVDFKLVDEVNLSTTEIANGFVSYLDETDDILVNGNAELYTNPTQEGELQANSRPPRAKDVTVFKNFLFYANVTQYRTLFLSVVAPTNISSGDTITIGTQVYKFLGNANNEPFGNQTVIAAAVRAANVITVTWTNHGFSTNDVVLVSASTTLAATTGFKTITVTGANTFTFADTGAAVAGTVTIEGAYDSTGRRFVRRVITATSATLSESIAQTAQYLVKAINRNTNSTVYAQYISGPTDIPGKIYLVAKDINAATYSITASSTTTGDAFSPTLPTSGTTVSDTQDSAPGQLYVSKFSEPEAVPTVNFFNVGSAAAEIYRIVALRDSVIIIKADGVFRLNGDTVANFSIVSLDNTVYCKGADSVSLLNNSVFMLSNQGVVQVSDSGVRIVSRPIEPLLSSIISKPTLVAATSATSYESERLYLLSTLTPTANGTLPTVTYCYNYLTDAWSTWNDDEVFFSTGLLSSLDDKEYLVESVAKYFIYKERKDQTRIDYTGQEFCLPVIGAQAANVAVTALSSNVTVTSPYAHNLVTGDVITVSRSSASISGFIAGGAASIEGVRTVTVLNDEMFTFQASANFTLTTTGTIYFVKGVSETNVSASTTLGLKTVNVTSSFNHGLYTGQAIQVWSANSALLAGFTLPTDITGYRTVTVTSPTTFTINATNAAIGGVSGTFNFSDNLQDNIYVTVQTPTTFTPQIGDSIVTDNYIYVIFDIVRVSSTAYVLKLNIAYNKGSMALAFLNIAYKNFLRTTPITNGNTGLLKYFGEFQLSFRNYTSCTQVNMNFANDSVNSSTTKFWTAQVGSDRQTVAFSGWGVSEWALFPWGGQVGIDRDYYTRPSVITRMYCPKEVFVGTFLQPIIEHRVAGEPLDLQSMSIFSQPVTNRTTK
jgi:hypothetical protein